jgi:hypothetical protein
MRKSEFFTKPRDGKVSLWVRVDDSNYNIWDLSVKEATPDVLKAIRSAFERGYSAASADVTRAVREGRNLIGFEWGIEKGDEE